MSMWSALTASLVSSGTGSFGSLVLNSSGGYTYTLNNGNAAVQALDEGETLTDTFTYAASDGHDLEQRDADDHDLRQQ